MDPFSQAALGAVVGQAVGHARLGYRAAAIGALAGALPDVDVLFSLNGDYFDQLVTHRGITHSLFFAPAAGPLLAFVVWKLEARRRGHDPDERRRLAAWTWVVTLALLSHPLLDYLTPYGTQLLLPFSNARFAVNAMPIIDPAYTLMLFLGLAVAGWIYRAAASRIALVTLALSCSYLAYGGYLNVAAEREAVRQLRAAGVAGAEVAAFPTVLQVHYRRVVARTAHDDRVGFISMWRPCDIAWSAAPREDPDSDPVKAFLATREGRIFDWFTMGWARYRVEPTVSGSRVRATDLRYGFTDDPDLSIFNASAVVDLAGRLVEPVSAGRDAADATGQRLALLFQDTYAAACTLAAS